MGLLEASQRLIEDHSKADATRVSADVPAVDRPVDLVDDMQARLTKLETRNNQGLLSRLFRIRSPMKTAPPGLRFPFRTRSGTNDAAPDGAGVAVVDSRGRIRDK